MSMKKGSFHFKCNENGFFPVYFVFIFLLTSIQICDVFDGFVSNITKYAILTVHHTIREAQNTVRIRLISACFGENSVHFVAVDHRGNIFVFELNSKKFWKLIDKVPKTHIIKNLPGSISNYIIGTKDGKIVTFDITSGLITDCRQFSHYRIENISFSEVLLSSSIHFVTYTSQEAFLVNLNNWETTHKLEFNINKISLKFVTFLPESDKILSCFTNDAVHIWSGITLNTIQILHPIRSRNRLIKNKQYQEVITTTTTDPELELFCRGVLQDFTKGLLNKFAFSNDGRFICFTTIDEFIIILSPISYEIIKLIKLKDTTCTAVCFVPQRKNLMLFALTSTADVVLIDCDDLLVRTVVQDGKSYRMNLCRNGKMLFVILKTGEINIFRTSIIINSLTALQHGLKHVKESKGLQNIKVEILDKELKKTLSKDRLIPILREYGEYPEKYRHLIWCTLLDLPCNKDQFGELAKRGLHPAVANYDQEYPLKDVGALRSLKKIMSCLIHWCPIFAHCTFFPAFIFPFLKIFPNCAMLTFELILSIVLNYCQLWFEFAPLEPLNYFGLIENALHDLDPELSAFYTKNSIPPKIYAWTLMTTSFSEVLDEHQWYMLWDNIFSNEPFYFIFCLVGYNIMQKNIIKSLENSDSIEEFFHEQNIIDMKKFIRRINLLMEKCPESVHPKRYIKRFTPIPKGYYPKFDKYPKKWVELKENEMETLRLEKEILDKRIRELERTEIELARRLEEGLKQEEYEKRMKEVEKLYGEALRREEERISCQRKMLVLYQKQIRERKAKVLELVRESAHRSNVISHENELDTLMRAIERSRNRDEADMMFADEDIKIRELNLLTQKYEMEVALINNEPFACRFKTAINKLEDEKKRLTEELRNLREDENNIKYPIENDLTKKITAIEKMLEQIQIEFIRTIKGKQNKSVSNGNNLKELEMKTNNLQKEVHKLLEKL